MPCLYGDRDRIQTGQARRHSSRITAIKPGGRRPPESLPWRCIDASLGPRCNAIIHLLPSWQCHERFRS